MNVRRVILAFVVALAVSAAMTWSVGRKSPQRPPVAAGPSMRPVVVAARPLDAGTRLAANDLTIAFAASMTPTPGSCTRAQDVVGRVLAVSLITGEPVLFHHLATGGVTPGLAASIPDGMRASTVRTDDAGVTAGLLQPGSFVDILVANRSEMNNSVIGSTALENIQILAVGGRTDVQPAGKAEGATAVTLLLKPQEADELNLALTRGRVAFTLRNGRDKARQVTETALSGRSQKSSSKGMPSSPLLSTSSAKIRSPQKEVFTVETITGGKSNTQNFDGGTR